MVARVLVHTQATITVEALHDGIDFSLALTRAKFEELNQDLFKKTLDVCVCMICTAFRYHPFPAASGWFMLCYYFD